MTTAVVPVTMQGSSAESRITDIFFSSFFPELGHVQKNRVRKRFGVLYSDTHLKTATIAATLGNCTMIEQFETHDGVSYHVVKHLGFFS